ncbi:hypothetical protein CEXT_205651 [Caerostris extrusa]|uniref:Uncharacterized protein n=1 Tax=Caerostris extrusa TaxID=172846 RepID=A0AAV4MA23_CAEEX|nr:hypothetical protein CEXT_205651 [Caerostris extrusa]
MQSPQEHKILPYSSSQGYLEDSAAWRQFHDQLFGRASTQYRLTRTGRAGTDSVKRDLQKRKNMVEASRPVSSRINILKFVYGILVPILLLPVILLGDSSESRCGYVILLMACYWVVEPIPVAATSLMPVVLFPLLGVITTSEASSEYMNGTNMMFVGGLFMAVAIEECNLHKRIALNVLRLVGPTPSWMIFGFMFTCMFLSMWISNTATTALMVPIIEAVMEEMGDKSTHNEKNEVQKISVISVDVKPIAENGVSSDSNVKDSDAESSAEKVNRLQKMGILKRAMLLSAAYSANIGGTGTLTGTGPNLVIKSVTEKLFPESNDLTFDKWMMYNVPVMLFCVFIAWAYLCIVHVRRASSIYTTEIKENLKEVIKKSTRSWVQ